MTTKSKTTKKTNAKKPTSAKAKKPPPRKPVSPTHPPKGSSGAKAIAAMGRPNGVTSEELIKLTGWLPHTARAFISAKVRKAMGLKVKTVRENAVTRYTIEG